jgi:uncharacterized glyoxalase superfamily protein PhnB
VISNRSVPTDDNLLPHVYYHDVGVAAEWLSKAFGFTEHYRYGEADGQPSGAQMHLGNAWIMLKRARPGSGSLKEFCGATQSLTVLVENVDEHFRHAKEMGAKILEELNETVYGERQYGAEDLGGHHWLFSRHARDLNPAEWGAKVSQPAPMTAEISPMLAVSDGCGSAVAPGRRAGSRRVGDCRR